MVIFYKVYNAQIDIHQIRFAESKTYSHHSAPTMQQMGRDICLQFTARRKQFHSDS